MKIRSLIDIIFVIQKLYQNYSFNSIFLKFLITRNQHTDNPMKHRQKVPCSICGKVLKSIVALKNHEDKHIADSLPESETKKFSCDLCGMRFRLKCYVFNHMNNVHLRNKYPCEFCGKGFYKKYEKMEHVVRMHTNERPILCEFEGCGKTFARQKNYNIHKVSTDNYANFLFNEFS